MFKLSIVLEVLSREWDIERREDTGLMPWEEWKKVMDSRFGTDAWRHQMEEVFGKIQIQSQNTKRWNQLVF